MAVQAQYPSNFLLFNNRGEQDMDYPQPLIDHPSAAAAGGEPSFFTNGANPTGRKRPREAPPPQQQQLFSLQPSPAFISLAQLLNHQPPLVSTGLGLAFGEQNSNPMLSSSSSSLISTVISDDLAQHKDEMDHFLIAQGEQLRREVAERRRRHYRALFSAGGRRLREKEAEVERAARKSAELEDRIARLRAESMAWQAKAMSEQATAASLHTQLQQAAVAAAAAKGGSGAGAGGDECGETQDVDDAGSAHIDPQRVELNRACRACRTRPATVVLLPCRHLCLCSGCDAAAAAAETCPVCCYLRTGSVQVFLS